MMPPGNDLALVAAGGDGAELHLVTARCQIRSPATIRRRPPPRWTGWTGSGGGCYPAMAKRLETPGPEFIQFLDYDVEIRRVICTTNATSR
jgi:hypothetical protein